MATQAEVFEAVCRLLEWRIDVLTKTERLRIGRVAKELREAGATVEILDFGACVSGPMFMRMRERGTVPKAENVLDCWSEIDRRWQARQRSLAALAKVAESPASMEEPLPIEENRRRWREMAKRYSGELVKDVGKEVGG